MAKKGHVPIEIFTWALNRISSLSDFMTEITLKNNFGYFYLFGKSQGCPYLIPLLHKHSTSATEIWTRTNTAAVGILSMMASNDDEAVASASVIAAAHQEDVLALMNAPVGATSTGALQQEALPPLIEIFHDTEHFSTYFDENGKPRWRCHWCMCILPATMPPKPFTISSRWKGRASEYAMKAYLYVITRGISNCLKKRWEQKAQRLVSVMLVWIAVYINIINTNC